MAVCEWFLLGAPWDCSGSARGEASAPAALRAAGLRDRVGADLGDAATRIADRRRDEETGVLALADTIAAAQALAGSLDAGMREHTGLRPLVVGGDCSLLLGGFTHLRRAFGTVGLWMADGHPDCLDPHASETGETADLDLALLTGSGPAALTGLAGAAPMVDPRHVALTGDRTAAAPNCSVGMQRPRSL
ncbi:arginase family protein [Actinoplanes sp. CA-030573]|uniref:arginase family protein n=1 Tax=Actinoplanes sp. CA-030573 TaxID=3239898 RepID=UPI003D8C2CB0